MASAAQALCDSKRVFLHVSSPPLTLPLGRKLLVLYGSETGNSEAISKRISQAAESRGFETSWQCFKDFRQLKLTDKWPSDCAIVIVVSSTGAGDPPENTVRWWRLFRKIEGDKLFDGVRYALLGLGDTNYDSYQRFPSDFCAKLDSLGAKEFYGRGYADDGTGLEDVVEPWIDGLWDALESYVSDRNAFTPFKAAPSSDEAPVPEASAAPQAEKAEPLIAVDASKPESQDQAEDTADNLGNKLGKKKYIRKKDGSVTVADASEVPNSPTRLVKNASAPENITRIVEISCPTAKRSVETRQQGSSKEHPILLPLIAARRLTHPEAEKEVLHLELDAFGTPLQFQPGDAFGIVPPNPSNLVSALFERLGLNGDSWIRLEALDESKADQLPGHIPREVSVRALFTVYLDLTSPPKRSLLRVLGEYASDPQEKEELFSLTLNSPEDKAKYRDFAEVGLPSLLEILQRFPSVKPPLGHLLDALPTLQPRYFSLSNDFLENNRTIEFAFTIVKNQVSGSKTFRGICSNFLKDLAVGAGFLSSLPGEDSNPKDSLVQLRYLNEEVYGFKPVDSSVHLPVFARAKEVQHFHLPKSLSTPLVMIGPGTGVAPFRGFLQLRQRLAASSSEAQAQAILFYGCRRSDLDFIYRDDLRELCHGSTELVTAFSRETDEVVYVQHKLEERGKELVDLVVNHGALIYVCGDANGMAPAVRDSWIKLLVAHRSLSLEEAAALVARWQSERKYLSDIWA